MLKRYLLAPGPTPVPPEVLLAMARPMFHHRAPEFDKVFAEVRDGLKWLFQTKNNVLMLAASGTGGMEGSVSNFLSPGDKALTINRSEEHTSELQSPCNLVCRLLLEKKKKRRIVLTSNIIYNIDMGPGVLLVILDP